MMLNLSIFAAHEMLHSEKRSFRKSSCKSKASDAKRFGESTEVNWVYFNAKALPVEYNDGSSRWYISPRERNVSLVKA